MAERNFVGWLERGVSKRVVMSAFLCHPKGSKADALAPQQVQAALIEVLTPICVDKFNRAENAQARLVEFKKMTGAPFQT